MFDAPFKRSGFDLFWHIVQNPNAFVDGVMNAFSLHVERPSYVRNIELVSVLE